MKNTILIFTLLTLFGMISANAQQKAPEYKITNIKIVPYDSQTGEFQDEFKVKDERSFFNDLSISLFVVVEITGEAGSYETGRKVQITAMEGKKLKVSRFEQIGLIGSDGKWYEPMWIYPSLCSDITISAQITGQKTVAKTTRSVPFLCGE